MCISMVTEKSGGRQSPARSEDRQAVQSLSFPFGKFLRFWDLYVAVDLFSPVITVFLTVLA